MAYTRTGYANFAAFPATGSANVIYVDLSNGNEYLWSTSAYVAYTGTLAGVRLGYQDAAWFAANPTFLLGKGQKVHLLQTGTYKIGDGVTALSGLAFLGGASATPAIQAVLTVGNVATTTIETTGFIKTGGTAAQFLKADGSVDSSTYLTTGAAALTYQPIGSYLTGLTIASTTITGGVSTKILYNNAGVLGEYAVTGTGTTAVLSTSPTFTTDITTPLIIGGTAVGSTLILKPTSANGTSTVAGIQFAVGNNGATTAMSVYNSGNVNIGNYALPLAQRLTTIGQDTAWMSFGSAVGFTTYAAMYFNTVTPGSTNYGITSDGIDMLLNAPGTNGAISLRTANNIRMTVNRNGASLALVNIDFLVGANTNQTLSTNIPSFRIQGASKQWATGTLATQYFNHFTTNTVAFVGASTATLVGANVFEYAQGGTNATNVTSAAIYVPTLALTNTTTGIGINIEAPSGATNNFAAKLNGAVNIGNYASAASQRLLTIGQDTAFMSMGSMVTATGLWAIYGNIVTPSGTNYSYGGSAATTLMNGVNDIRFQVGGANQVTIDANVITVTTGKNFVHGTAALATTATNGFHYVPTCAGVPTGVPTAYTGNAAMVYDSTNNKLYVYGGGAWNIMN